MAAPDLPDAARAAGVPSPARRPPLGALAGVLLALALAVLAAFAAGRFPVRPQELLQSLWAWATASPSPLPADAEVVIWRIRLPRIGAGMLVGAALGAAGAAFQGMFRNPLVSPDILGVSAGCGLGASLAILLGWPLGAVSGLAFAGGLLAVAVVMFVAGRIDAPDPTLVLVLAGVAVGALLGAGISLVKLLADPSVQLPSITFWLLGGLNAVTTDDLRLAAPTLLLGLAPLLLWRWRINLLSLPDDEAAALGVNVPRLRLAVVAAATLVTASAVAMAGIIGWVGLVVPHVARLLVGPEFTRLMPMSALLGAAFVVLADTLARTAAAIELPLSVLTAAVGAPFFLWLLARGAGRP